MEKKTKVVGYIRSATPQTEDEMNEKVSRLNAILNEHISDWEVAEVIIDNGYSGRNSDRPGLQKILQGFSDCSAVVTLGYHMIARDTLLFQKICQELQSKGKALIIGG